MVLYSTRIWVPQTKSSNAFCVMFYLLRTRLCSYYNLVGNVFQTGETSIVNAEISKSTNEYLMRQIEMKISIELC